VLPCPAGRLGHFLKVTSVSACRHRQQVIPVPDPVRIRCQGRQALAHHRLPFLIAGNGINSPLDLDIHLQPGRARMVGHRDHVIEVAARVVCLLVSLQAGCRGVHGRIADGVRVCRAVGVTVGFSRTAADGPRQRRVPA